MSQRQPPYKIDLANLSVVAHTCTLKILEEKSEGLYIVNSRPDCARQPDVVSKEKKKKEKMRARRTAYW